MRISVADIARLVSGELVGDGSAQIIGCAGITEAREGEITFLANPKYLSHVQTSQASAIIVPKNLHTPGESQRGLPGSVQVPGKVLIRADNPSLAFSRVMDHFAQALTKDQGPAAQPEGIDPTALVRGRAKIGKGASIGAYTVVEEGAVIGANSSIYAHCYVGVGTSVGTGCLIYPGVVLRERVSIGNNVIIHSGTVIGSDGFGYVAVDGKHIKIPQLGTVVIEDDVEIGANVTIDRARFNKTVIGTGTKIDNLVQIAHNVTIGKHCLIVSQSGVSGSTRLGDHVVLAGQSGVVGHLTIGDRAIVTAQSGVSKSIKAGEQVFGSPAQPIKEAYKTHAHVQRLQQYAETIKGLKKRVEELEKRANSS